MKYSVEDLIVMVNEFRALPAETGWLEFKANMADPLKIARYISALSNMAAYYCRSYGYLIWGVDDITHDIVGTDFCKDTIKAEKNQPLELWLRLVVKPQIAYEFYEFEAEGKRLVLLEIESAYREPVTARGGGWARIGNALVELSKNPRIAASIYRSAGRDWSAEIVPSASISDLDEKALAVARSMFMDKQWGKASRKDIDNVLREKLQEGLHESEKTNRITYLITSLRRANVIRNIGSRTKSEWVLCADIEVQKEI